MRVIIFSALLLFCAYRPASAGESKDPLDQPHITGSALKAASVALQAFEKAQPKARLKHFDVYIEEFPGGFQVEFVPAPSPLKTGCEGDDCYVSSDIGGRTANGRDVRYRIERKTGKIAETIYPK